MTTPLRKLANLQAHIQKRGTKALLTTLTCALGTPAARGPCSLVGLVGHREFLLLADLVARWDPWELRRRLQQCSVHRACACAWCSLALEPTALVKH